MAAIPGTYGELMEEMEHALTLEGAEQQAYVQRLLAQSGPHARENIGYLTGYFDREKSSKLRELFSAPHPVFGMRHPTPEEAFEAGVVLASKVIKVRAKKPRKGRKK